MILESIVTTVDANGQINIAPMGPVVTCPEYLSSPQPCDPGFVLRPFAGSRTFENLIATKRATIHVTDDAALFAEAALGQMPDTSSLVRLTRCGRWAILRMTHRWFNIEVAQIDATPPRYEMQCKVIDSAIESAFFGFNRAKHAVIEAAILATRTHLIPAAEVRAQLIALQPLVEKTAGTAEQVAFERLITEIESRLSRPPCDGTA